MRLPDSLMQSGAGAATGFSPWGAIAGIGSGIINAISQGSTNKANEMQSLERNNWEKMMSDSAHQREVLDLKNAGLNPILSAGGSGASTPSGSQATMVAPQINMPDMMAYGISLKQLEQADQKIKIDKANSAAAIAKNLSSSDLDKAQTILSQKGLLRANLEGKVSEMASDFIKMMKDGPRKNRQPNPNPQGFTEHFKNNWGNVYQDSKSSLGE